MKNVHRKRAVILTGVLALLVCVGVAANQQERDNLALEASEGYADYEKEQLAEHDGEILVDSISISSKEGSSSEQENGKAENVSELVTSDDLESLKNTDTYYDEVRATINMDRNEILSMLTSVIEETKDGAEKDNATQQKLKIIEYMNKESEMENLIANKGFSNALVLMSDSTVTVTVNKQDLTQSDIAKITDIVMRETGRSADKIVIQSKF